MAEGDYGQEKTEEPTPRKREQAKEDGKVVSSKEMFVFASISGGALLLLSLRSFGQQVASDWARFFKFESVESLDLKIQSNLSNAFNDVLWYAMIVGIPLMVVVILMQTGIGGINFAPKALGFKPEKINPLKGMKRMVSMQALVELGKAILKVSLLVASAAGVVYALLPRLDKTTFMDAGDALGIVGTSVIQVVSSLLIGLAIIGAIDLAWQLYSNTKSLRMSRQEIKDEYKQSEGSPELKGAIRRRQMEASQKASQQRAALADVPSATAVITNPTHFAVAVKYSPGQAGAPTIVAMGKGPMAHEIIALAKESRVRVMRIPPLARALYFTGDIGAEISYELYTAVATILAHVYRVNKGLASQRPNIKAPKELLFDEFGQVIEGAKT